MKKAFRKGRRNVFRQSFLESFLYRFESLLKITGSCLQLLADTCIMKIRSVIKMAKTSAVYARIDTALKENAENILAQLGITRE